MFRNRSTKNAAFGTQESDSPSRTSDHRDLKSANITDDTFSLSSNWRNGLGTLSNQGFGRRDLTLARSVLSCAGVRSLRNEVTASASGVLRREVVSAAATRSTRAVSSAAGAM